MGNARNRINPCGRVSNHSPRLAHPGRAHLELRLDEEDRIAGGLQEGGEPIDDEGQGDEREVRDHEANDVVGLRYEVADIHSFADGHPWIAADDGSELTVAYVHGEHVSRAGFEEYLSESARRRSRVEASAAGDHEPAWRERLDGSTQLPSASGDVGIGCTKGDDIGIRHVVGGTGLHDSGDPDPAVGDERLCVGT